MWNQDEVEGKAKKIKGKIKDKAGEALNNPEMENEGEAEQIEGNIQENIGKARRKIEETVRENLRD
jgi:uncharacterized protein YjbJ (UPF0337 family)